ncbi:MAG: hypothetical protein AAF583_09735, partial [Pseudomonadota bacterium]
VILANMSFLPLILFAADLPGEMQALEAALKATEAPISLRIAFDVELISDIGRRVFRFDPRWPEGNQWRLSEDEGEDAFLDEVAATWGAEAAPDGRLFPDDLRASIGPAPRISEIGDAWRFTFQHAPSANDGEFDVWAAERLQATAWLSPVTERFLRIDYELPRPVRGPEGGRLLRFDQSYLLEADPVFGFSLITAVTVAFEARGGFRTIERRYSSRILQAEVFFATPADEAAFLSAANTLP